MEDIARELMQQYLGYVRAMQLWFHGAHHSARGTSFAGDHGILYTKIYQGFQDHFDEAAEKAIGLYDEHTADPLSVTVLAANIMQKYASPCELNSVGISLIGAQMVTDFLQFVENMFHTLEESNSLSLGLNDFLAAEANTLEGYLYLLKQRIKEDNS